MTDEPQIRQVPGMSEMCSSPQFKALLDYRREHCPYLGNNAVDPTSIIRNEGAIQGWYKCIEAMKNTNYAPPKVTEETGIRPKYEDPDKPTPIRKTK